MARIYWLIGGSLTGAMLVFLILRDRMRRNNPRCGYCDKVLSRTASDAEIEAHLLSCKAAALRTA